MRLFYAARVLEKTPYIQCNTSKAYILFFDNYESCEYFCKVINTPLEVAELGEGEVDLSELYQEWNELAGLEFGCELKLELVVSEAQNPLDLTLENVCMYPLKEKN